MEVFEGGKRTSNAKAVPLKVVSEPFWWPSRAMYGNVRPFGVYVGPMLGPLVSHMGFHGGGKNNSQPKTFRLFFLGGGVILCLPGTFWNLIVSSSSSYQRLSGSCGCRRRQLKAEVAQKSGCSEKK